MAEPTIIPPTRLNRKMGQPSLKTSANSSLVSFFIARLPSGRHVRPYPFFRSFSARSGSRAIRFSRFEARHLQYRSMKYRWPLPVTLGVRLSVTWPSECVTAVSLMRKSPISIARWVGTFVLEPDLPR